MIIKTEVLRDASSSILLAINADKKASTLEIITSGNTLFLNVSNGEYYVSIKSIIDETSDFRATVDAKTFLNLVSGIQSDTFNLTITDKAVKLSAGKSTNYSIPIIMNGSEILRLKPIFLQSPSTSINISNDILMSILEVNSKEIQKLKNMDVNDIHKQYYLSNEGCFTYATGTCINAFTLDKPLSILLNERIVKLFKLFKTDVLFNYGKETLIGSSAISKISLESDNIFVGAIINSDDLMINKIKGPYESTKRMMSSNFKYNVDLPVADTLAVLNRLTTFNSSVKADFKKETNPLKLVFTGSDCLIIDPNGNTESITVKNNTSVELFTIILNGYDLKQVLSTCETSEINMKFGLDSSEARLKPCLFNRNNITNLIPEWPESEFK